MKLEHSFEVKAPIDRVWETLIDIERVAPCLPGAEVTESEAEGVYEGNFTIKLGPTTAAYAGKLELTEVDEAAHRVTMSASGRDKRGQGSAKATIVSAMSETAGRTHVDVGTDFSLTGRLARFGRGGMIEDVSNKLVGDFVECMRASLESTPAEPAGASAGEAAAPNGGSAQDPTPSPPPRAPQPEVAPLRGGRLLLSVLWTRIKRLFSGRS